MKLALSIGISFVIPLEIILVITYLLKIRTMVSSLDYTGYGNMVSILDTIDQLATDQKADKVKTYTGIVKSAIGYIRDLSATFQRGFQTKCEYAMLEYNTYVYCCVAATSSLIYEFVDYIKRPDKSTMTIQLKNTTVRANLFYFQQLMKFNRVQEEMGMDYRKMLESMMQKTILYMDIMKKL